jgi:hypothetical protein
VNEATPSEIAKALGVTGLTFRNWLRAQKAAGHPILVRHEYRTRYRFTSEEAALLIAEYRSGRGAASVALRGSADTTRGTGRRPSTGGSPRGRRHLPKSFAQPELKRAGFVGWTTWPQLRSSRYSTVPHGPGVYVVYRPSAEAPTFVHPSPAGWFKGDDPSVPEARLLDEWVRGAQVVYIGKADALRQRLVAFGRFGVGQPVGHCGGRLIWHLTDADGLLVAWHEITWGETARDYERRLLAAFAETHNGRRPFANLTG